MQIHDRIIEKATGKTGVIVGINDKVIIVNVAPAPRCPPPAGYQHLTVDIAYRRGSIESASCIGNRSMKRSSKRSSKRLPPYGPVLTVRIMHLSKVRLDAVLTWCKETFDYDVLNFRRGNYRFVAFLNDLSVLSSYCRERVYEGGAMARLTFRTPGDRAFFLLRWTQNDLGPDAIVTVDDIERPEFWIER